MKEKLPTRSAKSPEDKMEDLEPAINPADWTGPFAGEDDESASTPREDLFQDFTAKENTEHPKNLLDNPDEEQSPPTRPDEESQLLTDELDQAQEQHEADEDSVLSSLGALHAHPIAPETGELVFRQSNKKSTSAFEGADDTVIASSVNLDFGLDQQVTNPRHGMSSAAVTAMLAFGVILCVGVPTVIMTLGYTRDLTTPKSAVESPSQTVEQNSAEGDQPTAAESTESINPAAGALLANEAMQPLAVDNQLIEQTFEEIISSGILLEEDQNHPTQEETANSPIQEVADAARETVQAEAQQPADTATLAPPSPAEIKQSAEAVDTTISIQERPPIPRRGAPGWFVQVSAKKQHNEATALAEQLMEDDFTAAIDETLVSGTKYYRVVLGPVSSRAEAEAVLTKARQLSYVERSIFVRRFD